MKIGLINDRPEHPVLAKMTDLFAPEHRVVLINESGGSPARIAAAEGDEPAALYLCKSHTPHALDLADLLESFGATVINGAGPTRNAQDRVLMAAALANASLPCPTTYTTARLADLGAVVEPIVVKSRISRRGDLVTHVSDQAQLDALLDKWHDESVITQPWVPNDGWDLKIWVAGDALFGASRPTPLALGPGSPSPSPSEGTVQLGATEIPDHIRELAFTVGAAFRLDIYGVDVIIGSAGPVVVDVNPFPGARGIAGFAEAVVELAAARAMAPSLPSAVGAMWT